MNVIFHAVRLLLDHIVRCMRESEINDFFHCFFFFFCHSEYVISERLNTDKYGLKLIILFPSFPKSTSFYLNKCSASMCVQSQNQLMHCGYKKSLLLDLRIQLTAWSNQESNRFKDSIYITTITNELSHCCWIINSPVILLSLSCSTIKKKKKKVDTWYWWPHDILDNL